MNFHYKRGQKKEEGGMISTRFKQFIDRKRKKMNVITPQGKVVAALNKCLALQGQQDGNQYYVAGEELYCPNIAVSEGRRVPGKERKDSYAASGRFKLGRITKDGVSFAVLGFNVKFRDDTDEMGLPDIVIEEADMSELDRNTPLKG